MNRPLLDLSKKIDSSITEILRTIAGVAHELAIPFFADQFTHNLALFEKPKQGMEENC